MNRLLQLFADNRAANKTARVQSRLVAEGEEATLYLYESVVADDATADWWGGVSAQSLVPQIRAITAQTIHLRINSPGGDVFAAQAIAQAIRDTKAHVVAHVDGYAASAATVIATADTRMFIVKPASRSGVIGRAPRMALLKRTSSGRRASLYFPSIRYGVI